MHFDWKSCNEVQDNKITLNFFVWGIFDNEGDNENGVNDCLDPNVEELNTIGVDLMAEFTI